MTTHRTDQPLIIESFEDLRVHEAEIVRRVNAYPHGGRLLTIDPLRLLGDVGVRVSPAAVEQWERHAGARLFAGTRNQVAYDALAASAAQSRPAFRIEALMQGGAT